MLGTEHFWPAFLVQARESLRRLEYILLHQTMLALFSDQGNRIPIG
jgi:hypothetical protein